nr:hypothetical protein [Tanacetum cinerariifolium]
MAEGVIDLDAVAKEMGSAGFGIYWAESARQIFGHILITYIIAGRSQTPEKICERLDDTWDWVSPRPERQSDAATGAPLDVESAHAEIEVPHMHKAHKKRRALGLRALSLGAPKKGSRRTNAQRDYEAKARRGLHEYESH